MPETDIQSKTISEDVARLEQIIKSGDGKTAFFRALKNCNLETDQIIYLYNVLIDAKKTNLFLQFFKQYKPHYFLRASSPKGFDKNILVKVCSLPLPPKNNENEYKELLDFFIDGFYLLCNIQDARGKTAFHWLALRGYDDLIENLISKHVPGIDLNIQDNNNSIPSDYAKQKNHEITYQILKSAEREASNVIMIKNYLFTANQHLFGNNPSKAISLCEEAILKFKQDDFYHDCYNNFLNEFKMYFYIICGRAYCAEGSYNEAITNYKKALTLVSEEDYNQFQAEIYFHQYETYLQLGNYDYAQKAYEYGLKSLNPITMTFKTGLVNKYKNNKQDFLKYCVKNDWVNIIKILLRTGVKLSDEIYKIAIAIWARQEEPLEIQALFDFSLQKGDFTISEYMQLYPKNLKKIASMIQAFDLYELEPIFKKINAQQLMNRIDKLINSMAQLDGDSKAIPSEIKKELESINFYLHSPNLVREATYKGGIQKVKELYDSELLRINMLVKYNTRLTKVEAHKVATGMTLLVRAYKVRRAYSEISNGKKYIKALSTIDSTFSTLASNPIQGLSKINIERLAKELDDLREDEADLYAALLDLPYKLQHATNYYYEVLNSGSLDSYTEIIRRDLKYKSKFSTNGNIENLGNGGFVFFRLFVDPVNGNETRYGDTSLIFDLHLLRRYGWISLHDQLKPFTNKNGKRIEKSLKWDNFTFLRVAKEQVDNTSNKSLNDKLSYGHRITSIKQKTTKKNTVFEYSECSFLDEIFYGEDILLGIVWSVIRELRHLEECGFRQYFLNNFAKSDSHNKVLLLGKLIKELFRIEGKYPVALHIEAKLANDTQQFTHIKKTEELNLSDRQFTVLNKPGDGRFSIDLERNYQQLELAKLRDQKESIESSLSHHRQQRKRKRSAEDKVMLQKYDDKIDELVTELEYINGKLNADKNKRQKLTKTLITNYKFMEEKVLARFDSQRLELLNKFTEEIKEMSHEELILLNQFIDEDLPTLSQQPRSNEVSIATFKARMNKMKNLQSKDISLDRNQEDSNRNTATLLSSSIGFHSSSKHVKSSHEGKNNSEFEEKIHPESSYR